MFFVIITLLPRRDFVKTTDNQAKCTQELAFFFQIDFQVIFPQFYQNTTIIHGSI